MILRPFHPHNRSCEAVGPPGTWVTQTHLSNRYRGGARPEAPQIRVDRGKISAGPPSTLPLCLCYIIVMIVGGGAFSGVRFRPAACCASDEWKCQTGTITAAQTAERPRFLQHI